MASPLSKMAPTAVVVGLVSYCIWPYMFAASGAGAKQSAAMPEIAPAQLSPNIMPPPQRDPFSLSGAAAAKVAAAKGTAAGSLDARAAKAATAADKRAAQREKTSASAEATRHLTLSATSIFGNRRFAVINGQVCAEGDKLKTSDRSGSSYAVLRILPRQVVVEKQGEVVTLLYSQVTAATKGGNPPRGAIAEPIRPQGTTAGNPARTIPSINHHPD